MKNSMEQSSKDLMTILLGLLYTLLGLKFIMDITQLNLITKVNTNISDSSKIVKKEFLVNLQKFLFGDMNTILNQEPLPLTSLAKLMLKLTVKNTNKPMELLILLQTLPKLILFLPHMDGN